MLIILFVTFMGLSIMLTLVQPFLTREKMISVSKKAAEEVEFNGVVNAATYNYVDNLIKEHGLQNNNITYRFTGNIRNGGKIQLRDEFTFEIKGEQVLNVANFGDWINITIPLKKEVKGQSQVYYRPSEL